MAEETQLLKGILEGCVLGIIAKEETYGYQILAELERYGFEALGEGTLYPVLTRLNKSGYIECRRVKSSLGPIRKYYSITDSGEERLEAFKKSFQEISAITHAILFEGEQGE